MIRFQKVVASVFGIGFIGKGGGSVAAGLFCIAWYFINHKNAEPALLIITTCIILILGTWASSGVEKVWGKDDKKVVIDEIAGMCISLLFIQTGFLPILCGFILFRFFDIVKPLFIRNTEKLPGGIGVMMDDVLAGIYTNIILQMAMKFKLF